MTSRTARLAEGPRLLGPHDEDRARRVADDVLRHAAQEEPAHGAAAVAAHEDHVRALGLGCLDDHVARVARPHEERHLDALLAAAFHEHLRELLTALTHLVELKSWAEPLEVDAQRLSMHAVQSEDPAEAILDLARHNNVDLIVLGAPSGTDRDWSQSTASTITAKAKCSVHVVRVPQR